MHMSKNRILITDQRERDAIINKLKENFLVEAGAGSGKTTSLKGRILALIGTGTLKPAQIAAITFTNKAAGEIKERVYEGLLHAHQIAETEEEKQRFSMAVDSFDDLFIGTIHSFCGRVLKTYPIESGLLPGFTEMTDLDEQVELDRAWRQFLLDPDQTATDQWRKLGLSLELFRQNTQTVIRNADLDLPAATVSYPKWDRIEESIRVWIEEAKPFIPVEEAGVSYDGVQEVLFELEFSLTHLDLSQLDNQWWILQKAASAKASKVTLKRWTDKKWAKEFKTTTLEDFQMEMAAANQSWMQAQYPQCIALLKEFATYYASYKRERNLVSFDDLLQLTALVLKQPEVGRHYRQAIHCLFIDEFQDTDPIQTEIMDAITRKDGQLRKGSLFVVGDPKQSIYRFRRADIEIYNRVKDAMGKEGEVLHLTSNFRSANALSRALTPVFERWFPTEEDAHQAEYAPMNTIKERVMDRELSIEPGVHKLDIPQEKKKDEALLVEAEAIARVIRQAVDAGNAKYEDFLLLSRQKKGLGVYAEVLTQWGIPVQVTGENKAVQAPEIQELNYLLQYLSDPTPTNLYIVLRGLFLGFSEQDILALKQSVGSVSLEAERLEGLADESLRERFKDAEQWLKALMADSLDLPPAVFFRKLIVESGILASAADRKPVRGLLIHLMEVVAGLQAQGIYQLKEIVQRIATYLNHELEEELDPDGSLNQTRIMNVHKSKGLEAAIVFLVGPMNNKGKRPRKPSWVVRREADGAKGYLSLAEQFGFASKPVAEPAHFSEIQAWEQPFLQAEEYRLLYVAATRAKHALVIASMGDNKYNPWQAILPAADQAMKIPENMEQPADQAMQGDAGTWSDWKVDRGAFSYRVVTPSLHNDRSILEGVEREFGGSAVFGSLIHLAFERLIRYGEAAADQVVEQEAMDLLMKRRGKRIVKRFMESDLYKRILLAKSRMPEMRITTSLADGSLFQGVIDLVFEEEEGWVIIDYKTDHYKAEADRLKLETYYQSQIQAYRDVFQEITKQRVKETQIYFTHEPEQLS
jgi:ATP-dependent helicase/nuclease subunit A